MPSAFRARSLNQWTAREISKVDIFTSGIEKPYTLRCSFPKGKEVKWHSGDDINSTGFNTALSFNGNHSQYENVEQGTGRGKGGLWGGRTFAGTSVSLQSSCQEPQMRETSALVSGCSGRECEWPYVPHAKSSRAGPALGALPVTAADSWVLHWVPLRDSLVRFKPVSPIYCTRSISWAVAPRVLPYGAPWW